VNQKYQHHPSQRVAVCSAAMQLLLKYLLLPRKRAAGCSAVLLKKLLHLIMAMLLLPKYLLLPRKQVAVCSAVLREHPHRRLRCRQCRPLLKPQSKVSVQERVWRKKCRRRHEHLIQRHSSSGSGRTKRLWDKIWRN
jgi:hypothetical protein